MGSALDIKQSRSNRHIVITGATSGIGRAIALQFASSDVLLSLIGRNAERMEEVSAACCSRGADVRSALIDVSDAQAMSDFLHEGIKLRAIDIVVAAAGFGGRHALAGPTGEGVKNATQIFTTNVLGVINTLAPVMPSMVERGQGRIAVIGSLAGWLGMPQGPAYSASKAAVELYSEGLRRLLAPSGVSVTTVLPGFVDTPMSRSLGGQQPWRWTPDQAARHIMRAIERGKRRCIFPWQMRIAIYIASVLPLPLLDGLLIGSHRYFEKNRNS